MLQTKPVRSSTPAPNYTHHRVGPMRFTLAAFEPGQWEELSFPEAPGGYATIDTSHIQVTGTMIDPNGVLGLRERGWMSSEDFKPIPEGIHRRLAITRAEIWCVRPRDGESSLWHVDELRLAAGQELVLAAGQEVFLVGGAVKHREIVHTPPTHFVSKAGGLTLVATEESYGFVWEKTTPL